MLNVNSLGKNILYFEEVVSPQNHETIHYFFNNKI